MKNIVGNRIRSIRKSQNLSQREVANVLGVTNATISSWEVGRTEPDMDTAKKLCSYLKCSLDDIAGKDDTNTFYLTEEEKEIIRHYRTSPHKEAIKSLLGL